MDYIKSCDKNMKALGDYRNPLFASDPLGANLTSYRGVLQKKKVDVS